MDKKELHDKAKKQRHLNKHRDIKAVWTGIAVFTCLFLMQGQAKAHGKKIYKQDFDGLKSNTALVVDEAPNDTSFCDTYFYDPYAVCQKYISNDKVREKVIFQISQEKTQELQEQIIQNIEKLQGEIKTAERKGQKTSFIAKLFQKVSPISLSGRSNYCTAGAMSVYDDLTDPVLREIVRHTLVDFSSSPAELHLSSHPNISCPAFCSYYKRNFGDNYIDRKSSEFKKALANLDAGDILIVRSSQNTSSGLHCVTFEKYDSKGNICVKGFNRESNYTIAASKIFSITKIPNQFRRNLQQTLERDDELLISLMEQNPKVLSRAYMANLDKPTNIEGSRYLIEGKSRKSVSIQLKGPPTSFTRTM